MPGQSREATTIAIDRNICELCDTDRSGRSARQLAQTVACGTPPADTLSALVGAAPEPSIGGNPPTWHCDHQFYTPLVAYAYRFPAFYEIRRAMSGHQFPLVRFPASRATLEFTTKFIVMSAGCSSATAAPHTLRYIHGFARL